MVVMLGKEINISHGTSNCNICTGEKIIWRGTIEEKKYEKFFTPLKCPRKSPSSSCDTNVMLNLKKHFATNFSMWSLDENKIKKEKNGKEKSMLREDVKILI